MVQTNREEASINTVAAYSPLPGKGQVVRILVPARIPPTQWVEKGPKCALQRNGKECIPGLYPAFLSFWSTFSARALFVCVSVISGFISFPVHLAAHSAFCYLHQVRWRVSAQHTRHETAESQIHDTIFTAILSPFASNRGLYVCVCACWYLHSLLYLSASEPFPLLCMCVLLPQPAKPRLIRSLYFLQVESMHHCTLLLHSVG